jgi:phospholipase/lecithinase/hemolysin
MTNSQSTPFGFDWLSAILRTLAVTLVTAFAKVELFWQCGRFTFTETISKRTNESPCDTMRQLQHREDAAGPQQAVVALLHRVTLVVAITFGVTSPDASLGAIRLDVVVFGDSLLDAGTYSPVAEPTFGGGRFTTNPGLNFTQEVALSHGSILTPAFIGGFGLPLIPAAGLDYAQGGSRVTMQPGIDHAAAGTVNVDFEEETTIPITDQVAEFLKAHKRFRAEQLILIDGGANDIFFQLAAAQAAGTAAAQQDAVKAITQSAIDLANVVATMVANGATHVVVINIPDIGKAPMGVASADHGQSMTQISQLFNTTLAGALQQHDFGEKVLLIDAFTFIDGIIANYQEHGFTVSNTGFACDLSAQVTRATELHLDHPSVFGQSLFCSPKTFISKGADETFMFADTVHPTTHLNAIVAKFVEQQIAERRW